MSNQTYLCDYGCGQEAKFTFKNGKKCCSKHLTQCPELKRKNSKANLGKKRSKETKEKLRNLKLGKKFEIKYEKTSNIDGKLCSYCNKEIAKYKFQNGKVCCCKDFKSCIKFRQRLSKIEKEKCKNSEYIKFKKSYLKGNVKSKSIKIKPNENIKCNYGCNKSAKYYFPTSKTYCCSKYFKQCKHQRKNTSSKQKKV